MEEDKGPQPRPGVLPFLLFAAIVIFLSSWASAQKMKRGSPKPVTPSSAVTDTTADNRSATKTKAGAQEMRILYKYAERTKGHFIASGNVEIHYGTLVLFGVPPEEYWPYTDEETKFDLEPPAFCYAFAQNYKTIKYYRHDPPGTSAQDVLDRVKTFLAAGHPAMFGFTVYNSISQADKTGLIPFPSAKEKIEGGHAVMAAGYDDQKTITSSFGRLETRGALLIRNSWGPGWGEEGYGWLPGA